MQGYTISEDFTLPSLGKVYDRPINPKVKLRSMTTEEEMKRLSHLDRQFQVISEIIDDCLIEKPGISSYDMCIEDYTFLLHKLRVVTYGPEYRTMSTCNFCGHTNESIIDLESLEVTEFSDEVLDLFEITLPQTQHRIKLRIQTPRMLDDISERVSKKSKIKESEFLLNIESFIDTVDGRKLDIVQLENFLRQLPMKDTNYLSQAYSRLVVSFGLKDEAEIECEVCGLDYRIPFRYTAEFFRPSINF